jgi:hypothetical protein
MDHSSDRNFRRRLLLIVQCDKPSDVAGATPDTNRNAMKPGRIYGHVPDALSYDPSGDFYA